MPAQRLVMKKEQQKTIPKAEFAARIPDDFVQRLFFASPDLRTRIADEKPSAAACGRDRKEAGSENQHTHHSQNADRLVDEYGHRRTT
jgi:hypothetical protein